MKDLETLGGIFLFSLLGLAIVILVLGISVKTRIARDSVAASPILSSAVIVAMVLVLAFFSTFLPFLAAFPALGFLIRGIQAVRGRDVLDRDGGIVIILAGLAWALFTGLQAAWLAWGKTVAGAPIRIDIVMTIPVMALVSFFGWWIQSALPVERLIQPSKRPGARERPPSQGPMQWP